MNKKVFVVFLISLCLAAACDRSPVNRLINPTVSNTTGVWEGPWVVYDDEIKTGGDITAITAMDGQVLDFNSSEYPHSGSRCIKFSWDGADVLKYDTGELEHDFSAFIFSVGNPAIPGFPSSRDLTPGGYTRISFWVRGSLSPHTFLRVEGNNATYQTPSGTNAWMSDVPVRNVTGAWQHYEFPLSGSLAYTHDFVRFIFRYDEDGDPNTPNNGQGTGGTVFIDDIQLSQ